MSQVIFSRIGSALVASLFIVGLQAGCSKTQKQADAQSTATAAAHHECKDGECKHHDHAKCEHHKDGKCEHHKDGKCADGKCDRHAREHKKMGCCDKKEGECKMQGKAKCCDKKEGECPREPAAAK
ncbi:MAG TPA: hypothetical protein VFV50_13605 [Bdellovibrionales bacterium]|nr:hypothetical protein [Bdellovibrionales bacterium]